MVDVTLTVDPGQPADPYRFFEAGQQLLHLLDELTDTESSDHDWKITALRLGSAVTQISSDSPARERAADRMVIGLAGVRRGEPLPAAWTPPATKAAQNLVKVMGGQQGHVEVEGRIVPLDGKLGNNLDARSPWVREMPGSVRGTLTGFNVNRGNRASLKLTSGRVVRCSFPDSEAQNVADAILRFVELQGTLRQDESGHTYWVDIDSVRSVSEAPMSWTDLLGYDPTVTGDLTAADYLAVARGEE